MVGTTGRVVVGTAGRVVVGAIFGPYVMNSLNNKLETTDGERVCNEDKKIRELFQIVDDYVEEA